VQERRQPVRVAVGESRGPLAGHSHDLVSLVHPASIAGQR
jgi:hypothetical protein